MSAEFRGAALSEVHKYTFFAVKDAVLSTKLTATPGLTPDVKLFTGNDGPVDLGSTVSNGGTIKNFKLAATGNYYFQVQATAGTGVYRLTTKVKYPKTTSGATTTGAFSFDAVAGSFLTAQVKASKGSTASPEFTDLTYLGGSVNLGSFDGTAKITKLALPEDKTYTLAIDPGTAGQSVDVKVTLVAPKSARLWSFGYVEDTTGLATQNRTKWESSAHADHNAMPFNDWNDSATQTIPTSCARCHSTPGYRDYLGADGTAAGVVDNPAPIGTVIECNACHNDQTLALTQVTFPSGLTVSGLGKEARCMVCHQGRESTVSVEAKITSLNLPDADTVSGSLSFMNVHYFAAGASLYGREAAGAYEYAEPNGAASDVVLTALPQRKAYDRKFTHVASKDTCIECHDPHSLQVRITDCAACHVNAAGAPVATEDDLRDIRMAGTVNDFDGDGNTTEGVAKEIEGLQAILYAAMQDYATKVAGTGIEYKGDSYPYFFAAGTTTKYTSWTARLLRAAYNYQYSIKDPGLFAHNGKFAVEFLYDSIDDLNQKLSALPTPSPVPNFANLHRNDPGHFDSSAEPYRHWDEDSDHLVDPSCARCHSIEGFQFVAKYGMDQTVPANLISGLSCETCHVQGTNFGPASINPNPDDRPERVYVASVVFPYPTGATSTQIGNVTINNGAKGTAAQDDSFICMTCHRARESKLTIDAAYPTPTTDFTLGFKNLHYLGAGATLYGSKAAVAYQYNGNTYVQRWNHDQGYGNPYPAAAAAKAQCTYCHMQGGSHSFQPTFAAACQGCHSASTSLDTLTPAFRAEDNYDNDVTTKPKAEFEVFQARLLETLQTYCANAKTNNVTGAEWVVYSGSNYPYFFKDTNHNGVLDTAEATSSNAAKFDTKGVRAAFNYQFSQKDPGAWAHNPKYTLQVIYDSIFDLDPNAVTGLTRPQ